MTTRALAAIADDVRQAPHVHALVVGKAARGMAAAIDEAVGAGRLAPSVCIGPAGDEAPGSAWRGYAGAHPQPTGASVTAGLAALDLADVVHRESGLLLVGISGGTSAMMAVPAPGLTIDDKAATTAVLLRSGLDIAQINLVRRHLSAIKGGRLAARAGRTITLAISDVCTPVEDDPLAIGSGPTVHDHTTAAQALMMLRQAGVLEALPVTVVAHLEREAATGGATHGPPSHAYWVVASRHDAMRAAADAAARLGYSVTVHREAVVGSARDAGAKLIAHAAGLPRPVCLIASGETTVQVRGHGVGGRNQELTVGALGSLAEVGRGALASIGTDGRDGPTDAAGAFVDDTMWSDLGAGARAICDDALDRNDTYPLLDRLGALVRTGPTGTNVGDLQIVLLQ